MPPTSARSFHLCDSASVFRFLGLPSLLLLFDVILSCLLLPTSSLYFYSVFHIIVIRFGLFCFYSFLHVHSCVILLCLCRFRTSLFSLSPSFRPWLFFACLPSSLSRTFAMSGACVTQVSLLRLICRLRLSYVVCRRRLLCLLRCLGHVVSAALLVCPLITLAFLSASLLSFSPFHTFLVSSFFPSVCPTLSILLLFASFGCSPCLIFAFSAFIGFALCLYVRLRSLTLPYSSWNFWFSKL